MPLQLPNLDDRNYDDLVEEAISLIPRHAPSWTDYNASDPGITLIELFAYFTELLIYRLDRIGREHKIRFLRLLLGQDQVNDDELRNCSLEDIERRIQHAVLDLKQPQRAVTCEDYEYLARQAAGRVCGEHRQVRALCVAGINMAADRRSGAVECPGHISLIVVADRDAIACTYDELLRTVFDDLEPRRLLTTRLHVVGPTYLWLALKVVIQPRDDVSWGEVVSSVMARLERFGSPFAGGGPDGLGWPFGRNLYLSEIYDVLDRVPGVDFVATFIVRGMSMMETDLQSDQSLIGVQIGIASTVGKDARIGSKFADSERFIADGGGKMAGIRLKSYELIKIVVREQDIEKVEDREQSGKRKGDG